MKKERVVRMKKYINKMNIQKKSISILMMCICVTIISFIISQNFTLAKTMLLCFSNCFIWGYGIHNIRTFDEFSYTAKYNVYKQVTIISFIVLLFLIASFISEYTNIYLFACETLIFTLAISIFLSFTLCWFYQSVSKNPNIISDFLEALQTHFSFLVVFVIALILRIQAYGTLQRWDAGEYYYAIGNACQDFEYSFNVFFGNFRLANHMTYGFTFLMSIGEFLNPRGINGVLTVNLILTLAALTCIYKWLYQIIKIESCKIAALFTLIVSLVPFFLGSYSYITPDYIMTLCFIFVIYHDSKKEYMLLLFWLLIMITTREDAIMTVFGYFLFKVIAMLLSENKSLLQKIKIISTSISCWIGILSGGIFLVIVTLQNGLLWKGGEYISDAEVNVLGFNFNYIIFRIHQYFILNFAWILSISLLFCFSILLYRKFKKYESDQKIDIQNYFPIIGGLTFSFISNAIFITAGAYRYATIFFTVFPVLVLISLYSTVKKQQYLKNYCYVLIILFGIQSYLHIDPISAILFETESTGSWYTIMSNYDHENYGNDLCNNAQYTWLDDALDEMLADANYDGTQTIILVTGQIVGVQINGNGTYYVVGWDTISKKRVIVDDTILQESNGTIINISSVIDSNLENTEIRSQIDEAIVFYIPYYNVDEEASLEYLNQWYEISEQYTVGSIGGELNYYMLSKDM